VAAAELMDVARDDLFASAGFAGNQDRRVAWRYLAQVRLQHP
jgi:hypothetical protein